MWSLVTSYVCNIPYKTHKFVCGCYKLVDKVNYIIDFKTQGSTEFITRRPWAVAPEQNEGATKGLRVINSVDPFVLKSNFFRLYTSYAPLQLPVTSRQ